MKNLAANHNLHLAVTLGDPAGIGPEVVLKALADRTLTSNRQVTVIGSRAVLEKTYHHLKSGCQPLADPAELNICDVDFEGIRGNFVLGSGNETSGAASFAYLETAIAATLAGNFHGIVTGPISKTYWQAAGHFYPGQTELLAEKAKVKEYGMLFVARSPISGWVLRTLLATTHVPLCQVSGILTWDLLSSKLGLLVKSLQQDFGIVTPRIAIAGLNPHSGENGQLGWEEKDLIIPWLEWERVQKPDLILEGPIPPDTMWVKPGQAWNGAINSDRDGYLAMYHDQGLIPVKLMAFDRAVNTTIGLPFVRTSPDHGTAFDIAGKGIADAASMKAALELAGELVKQRLGNCPIIPTKLP